MLVVNFSTGLSIVLQFLRNIFPVADETTSTQESLDWIEEAIIVTLEFLRGVMEKVFEISQAHGLIIGVLTTMQSIIVSHLKSFEHRRRLTDMITYLLLQAAPNFDVPEKSRTTLLHYSLRHIMRCNQDNSIPDMHKKDWKKSVTVSCTHRGNSPDSFDPSSGGPSFDRITAVWVGSVYSEGCRASAVGIVALSDDSIAAKFTPMYESCEASNGKAQPVGCRHVGCGGGIRMFECVPWSVTGLGVVALHLARSLLLCEDEQTTTAGLDHRHLPSVLSPSYVRWLCRAYLPHLLRDTSLATAEGVRGIQLLGVISNAIEQKDVFLSPVCSIEGDELLSSPTSSEKTMNSIVVSTDSAMTILEPFTEQLWRLHQVQDHSSELESITITISQNILIHLAAESRERLFLCQGIISAMVACSDTTLRSAAYAAFKLYLIRSFEESSLFELLLKLCDCCPFQQISGLLIDLAKECAQDASHVSAIQPTTSPSNDNDHPHEEHWFGSISSEPHNAFHKVFRSKNIGASMQPPVAVDSIAPMIPRTWEEWQSSYEIIHNTTATPTLSYAIHGSSIHGNHSVFWSPLLVSMFFLHPLKVFIKEDKMVEDSSKKADFMASKPDKLDDLMDVVAARVNLMLFVTLRLQAGLRDYATSLRNPYRGYTSACSRRALLPLEEAVGDLFEAVRVTQALQSLLRSKLEVQLQAPSNNANSLTKKKRRSDLVSHDGLLQVQVLDANVDYLLNNLKSLCTALLTSLATSS
eukprot:gene30992-40322_t